MVFFLLSPQIAMRPFHHLVRLASRQSLLVFLRRFSRSWSPARGLQSSIRDHGFSRATRRADEDVLKIRLPQALPDIFTGLKVGAALSSTPPCGEFVASTAARLSLRNQRQSRDPHVIRHHRVLSLPGSGLLLVRSSSASRFRGTLAATQRETPEQAKSRDATDESKLCGRACLRHSVVVSVRPETPS